MRTMQVVVLIFKFLWACEVYWVCQLKLATTLPTASTLEALPALLRR